MHTLKKYIRKNNVDFILYNVFDENARDGKKEKITKSLFWETNNIGQQH